MNKQILISNPLGYDIYFRKKVNLNTKVKGKGRKDYSDIYYYIAMPIIVNDQRGCFGFALQKSQLYKALN